jgi:hypothetical protein
MYQLKKTEYKRQQKHFHAFFVCYFNIEAGYKLGRTFKKSFQCAGRVGRVAAEISDDSV